jgi:uncharacterized membrane protein YfcA
MSALVVLGVVVAFVVGAGLQRIAGMGLGLVAAPSLSLMLGPVAGVTMSNLGAIVAAALILGAMRAHVDWGRFARIGPLIAVGAVAGALVVREVDPAWLDVVLGASVLLALALSLGLQARVRVRGTPAAVAAGVVSGFLNTTSGVAAPVMAIYALATRWDQRSFAATLQPIFLVANTASVVAKAALGATPEPGLLPWWIWPVVVLAVLVGVGTAGLVARRVPPGRARSLAIGIALTGGVLALGRGITNL